MEGYNGRLDAIQAGILRVNSNAFPSGPNCAVTLHLDTGSCFEQRTAMSSSLTESARAMAVYHLFVVRVQNRERLIKHLASAGIGTGIHYPIPLHLQKAYAFLGYTNGEFPVAERMAMEIVSLPMFPGIEAGQQSRVVDEISSFVGSDGRAMAAVGQVSIGADHS